MLSAITQWDRLMADKMFDELSLRLLRAFFAIEDRAAREVIVALAEAAAAGAKIEAHSTGAAEKKKDTH